jgi:hypothetical protein
MVFLIGGWWLIVVGLIVGLTKLLTQLFQRPVVLQG